MSLISVILPTYNRASFLTRSISSVLVQSFTDFDLHIVDDGSSDETADVVHSLASRTSIPVHYHPRPHSGVSAARNWGISHSQGEWIALIDSDDEWLSNKLEVQMSYLRQNPDLLLCQGNEIWIRHGRRVNPRHKHYKPSGWIFSQCLPLCVVSPSAVIIHRSVFHHVGLFNEALPACEDYDLWLRVSLHYRIDLIPEFLLKKYGGHSDQLSSTIWGLDRFRIQSLENLLATQCLSHDQQKDVLSELIHKCTVYAQGCRKRDKLYEEETYRTKLDQFKQKLKNLP